MSLSLLSSGNLQDKETEDALIGSVLIGGNATFLEAAQILGCKDFYQERLRVIWETFTMLVNDESIIDPYTVNDRIGGKTGIDLQYLMELAQKGNYLRIRQYAEIVRKRSISRMSLVMFEEQRKRILAGEDPRVVLSQGMTNISALLDSHRQDDPAHIREIVPVVLEEVENRYQNAGKMLGVPTGFETLDNIINGIRGITVLAARPGMGKTTFALNVALNSAKENPVLFFSLEMDREELTEKLISNESGLFGRKLERPSLMEEPEWVILADGAGKLYDKNIWIDDSPENKASEIAIRARRMTAQHDIKLIVIDYLQLIDPERPTGNRNFEISESLRVLKKMSRELKVPILLLSQLSRDIERRKDKKGADPRPNNADLRDSGSIEQDAHIIMFLYSLDSTDKDSYPVNLLITKNRKGRKNVELNFVFMANKSQFMLPNKY